LAPISYRIPAALAARRGGVATLIEQSVNDRNKPAQKPN